MLAGFGLMIHDMDRRRRQLATMIDRVEPLVDRPRRLHIRNMRGLNGSLFYTGNLLDQLEQEITLRERDKGIAPPAMDARFSLRPGRRFRDLEIRIASPEAARSGSPVLAGSPVLPGTDDEPSR